VQEVQIYECKYIVEPHYHGQLSKYAEERESCN